MDDSVFANIRHYPHHLLHKLLPDITDHTSDHVVIPSHYLWRQIADTISTLCFLKTFVSLLAYGCVMLICLLKRELLKTDRRQTTLRRNVSFNSISLIFKDTYWHDYSIVFYSYVSFHIYCTRLQSVSWLLKILIDWLMNTRPTVAGSQQAAGAHV